MIEKEITVTIKSEKMEKYKVNAIINKNNNIIYYVENDNLKTVNIFDYQNNILKRDNENIYLEIEFDLNKKTHNKLELKEFNNIIDLEVETSIIEKTENEIIINYTLNDYDYLFKLEMKG